VRLPIADPNAPKVHSATRRYHCVAGDCGWDGFLSTGQRKPPSQVLRRTLMTVMASMSFFILVTFAAVLADRSTPRGGGALVPRGVSHDGDPPALKRRVSMAIRNVVAPSNPPRLAVRRGCAWGQPGRNPYQGTAVQALMAAGLPPESVGLLAEKIRTRAMTDMVMISSEGIRTADGSRVFKPQDIAMTFGQTMCVGARVNFVAGHEERADLYEIDDPEGGKISVMVPHVCGNVSVLGARGERAVAANTGQDGPLDWLAETFKADQDSQGAAGLKTGQSERANQVPEPAAWWALLMVGLAAWWASHRARARRSQG
jgi:hypothetical protein